MSCGAQLGSGVKKNTFSLTGHWGLLLSQLVRLNFTILIIIIVIIIIGATGTISKSFRKYVSTIPRNHDVTELQKTAILGTAHRLRKVLL
jgi:hypothetical protein